MSEGIVDLPTYVVINGPLKDLGFSGTAMRGPANDTENYKGDIFIDLVTVDQKSVECSRRLGTALKQ